MAKRNLRNSFILILSIFAILVVISGAEPAQNTDSMGATTAETVTYVTIENVSISENASAPESNGWINSSNYPNPMAWLFKGDTAQVPVRLLYFMLGLLIGIITITGFILIVSVMTYARTPKPKVYTLNTER